MKHKLTVIFTCFNRKEKTVKACKSLVEKNPNMEFQFIVVDDKSTDGTVEAIKALNYNIKVIEGTGSLFWCGGMRVGIDWYFQINDGTDCLLINDDVDFYDAAIEKMIQLQRGRENVIIVGATCDGNDAFTYGLRKHRDNKGIWLNPVEPNKEEIVGETMNANCVLISNSAMKKIGNMDSHYSHSLGDYDLGFRISRMGYKLISSAEFVGHCEDNGFENSWRDPELGRLQRLKKKESAKGSPFKEWWHFLYKNYGLRRAVLYSIVPFVKILLEK
ncbi:MAG: glycosyltransferase family 2 protein [Hespellia sp.]|nr:glycosyltransferase family 2 protein [Hespellia sp.]